MTPFVEASQKKFRTLKRIGALLPGVEVAALLPAVVMAGVVLPGVVLTGLVVACVVLSGVV